MLQAFAYAWSGVIKTMELSDYLETKIRYGQNFALMALTWYIFGDSHIF